MIDTGAAAFLSLSFKVVSSRNFAAGTVTAAVVNLLQSHSWGPLAVVAVLLLRLNIWPVRCLLFGPLAAYSTPGTGQTPPDYRYPV